MINLLLVLLGVTACFFALLAVLIFKSTIQPKIDVPGDYDDTLDHSVDIEFKQIKTNGITLHTALAGPEDGTPLILLHGFPDVWSGWEYQVRYFAAWGYRVVAPDQRGNGLSDKPPGIEKYYLKELVDDIIGLADAVGFDTFYLAGHDFGAVVSYNLAMKYPKRLRKMIIVNVPHPRALNKYMRKHPSQFIKSWYAFFFQIPVLPEITVKLFNWKFYSGIMSTNFSRERLERYRESWSQPNTATSMINWYRAMVRRPGVGRKYSPRITVPLLIIWGKLDPHISLGSGQGSLEYCDDGQITILEDAGHWAQQDRPLRVSRMMQDFFR